MGREKVPEKKNKKTLLGSAEILGAAIVWGYGYIVIRDSLVWIPLEVLMTWRYLIAFLALLIICAGRWKKLTKRIWIEGAILGGLLYFAQYFQTLALGKADTTAGRVAFITALYVVFVPFLNWILSRRKPSVSCYLSLLLAVPGLYLLTGREGGGIGTGDMLALVGSLGFSLHILAADRFVRKNDDILLTMLQFGSAAFYAGIVQGLLSTGLEKPLWGRELLWPLVYLGVFSTLLGFFLQLQGQKYLSPEVSAVLLASEAIFGMVFSVIYQGERLTVYEKIGGGLMLGAIWLAEQKKEPGKRGILRQNRKYE